MENSRRLPITSSLLAFLLLLSAFSTFAGTPAPLPKVPTQPPLIPSWATWPDAPARTPVNAAPLTLETLRTAVISGPIYYSTLLNLGLVKAGSAASGTGATLPDEFDEPRPRFGPLRADAPAGVTRPLTASVGAPVLSRQVLATGVVGSSWNFTTGGGEQHQEVEPYIYTQGSTPTTVILSQRLTQVTNPDGSKTTLGNLWSSQTYDFMNFTYGYLPMPSLTTGTLQQTTDPWLAGNPYTTGLNPGWLYATGIAFQIAAFGTPNALVLWHSTDGGQHWVTPTESGNNMIVERTPNYLLDKPAMAVSTNSNFLGRVYVGYSVTRNGSPQLTEIHLARSRDGLTFDVSNSSQPLDDILIEQGTFTGAQVIVDNSSGLIYVIYFDMANRKMKMATVVDSTSYPPQRLWVSSIEDVTGTRSGLITSVDANLNGGVRAWSLPAAVFYWPAGRIYVTWHERSVNGTDIFLAWKKVSTPADPSWSGPVQLTSQANDQFMPAIDYDSNDKTLVVGYYDRSADALNLYYGNSFVIWDDVAGSLKRGPTSMTGTSLYNPDVTPFITGDVGDYQGIFGWNFSSGPRHNSTYIRTGSTYAVDAWATGIQ